ncbi:hypothetical protein [Pseudochelatococcus contaminans]|uniref:Uncharacterized protein n=1 Tax=Pseudochelatococcus contaminans TaxID=1538103 RepID=A0A7W6EFH1_9HYPH|nr:hypothetical protein [Pseudochelatococcus contaminans]MBB3808776.1 hypothetical protein [Pseudochelatococcus contaminans]
MSVVPFESAEDIAYRAFLEARERAIYTGDRQDAQRARRLFAVYCETILPVERRSPRDPVTLRILAPSEIGRRS